jgi:hypothetical protein
MMLPGTAALGRLVAWWMVFGVPSSIINELSAGL